MNKDQIKGTVKNVAGKAQEKMGNLVGSMQKAAGEFKQATKPR